jgi:hypothetical protein
LLFASVAQPYKAPLGDKSMNPIEEQRKLIDQLHALVVESIPVGATSADCRFDYFKGPDGAQSVGTELHYELDGNRVSARLLRRPERAERPIRLVPQLHALMKAHTGGDWVALRLTITPSGRASAHFEYS